MKAVWLFPGQGAQGIGMGRDLAAGDPAGAARFEQAGDLLGYDLARLCFEGPLEELTRSDRAQPALFVTSVVVIEALRRRLPDLEPAACGGLSSGEWAALYAAGAVSFEDTVRILDVRGRLMQEACRARPGGMLSVLGLSAGTVERMATEAGVFASNYNAPDQTVLSGPLEGIARAEQAAAAAGAKRTVRLQVAGAFHSPLMQSAADGLAAFLEPIPLRAPRVPVYSNVTGRPHGKADDLRRLMIEQICAPVRWVDCMQGLASGGDPMLECGPGRVLAGLAKRIDKLSQVHTISDRLSLDRAAGLLDGAKENEDGRERHG